MKLDRKALNSHEIKEQFRGNGTRLKMLLEEFRKHNDQCRSLIGTEYSQSTVWRFDRVVRYLGEYMNAHYRHDDIPTREVDHAFVSNFEYFLKTEKQCGYNAMAKQL